MKGTVTSSSLFAGQCLVLDGRGSGCDAKALAWLLCSCFAEPDQIS